MLGMVAVVPQPPLMVPQLTGGPVPEAEPVRSAALAATTELARSARRWIVVGSGVGALAEAGTFSGYGVDVPVWLRPGAADRPAPDLPLPLLIAGWLRGQVAPELVTAVPALVAEDLATEDCRRAGADLAAHAEASDEPVGLLVVGDGAATHTEKAPGHLDRRAGRFDAAVARALARADPAGLLGLDPALAAELGAAGRASWQVLAGAALAAGTGWRGELTYSAAPLGVGYHVALWRRR